MGALLLGARPILQIGGKAFSAPEIWDWATEVVNSGGTFIISAADPITPDYKSMGTDEQGNPSFFEPVRNTVWRRAFDITTEPFPSSGTWYLYALRRGYENTLPFDRDDEDNFFRVYSPTETTYALIQINVGSLTDAVCPMFPVHGSSWHRSEWVAVAAFVAVAVTVGVAAGGFGVGTAAGAVSDVATSGAIGTAIPSAGEITASVPVVTAAATSVAAPIAASAAPLTFSEILAGAKTAAATVSAGTAAVASVTKAVQAIGALTPEQIKAAGDAAAQAGDAATKTDTVLNNPQTMTLLAVALIGATILIG